MRISIGLAFTLLLLPGLSGCPQNDDTPDDGTVTGEGTNGVGNTTDPSSTTGQAGNQGTSSTGGANGGANAGGAGDPAGAGHDAGAGVPAPGSGSSTTDAGLDPTTNDAGTAPGAACDKTCGVGQNCELVAVTCIQAPCPPLPECVDAPICGGFAGFACKGIATCVDDPRDDCDSMNGGADCIGFCACEATGKCAKGMTWNASPSVCGCVAAAGEACGDTICAIDQVCCNPLLSICTPPDGACAF